ncbi:hypothetical protein [Propionicimonas paludicola]|nr:hypothetical protein [Propionicimonas paludicola]
MAIDLSGGLEALAEGQRLRRLTHLTAACHALRRPPYAFADPLLEVPMYRIGGSILALVDGTLFNPLTGQQALQVAPDRAGGLVALVANLAPGVLKY